jgi:hypothetical protein
MKSDDKNQYLTRLRILRLLSDEEVGSVSTAQTAEGLSAGDQYLDLSRLDQGVRRAVGTPVPMCRVIPKKAVRQATWTQIVAQLATLARSLSPHEK